MKINLSGSVFTAVAGMALAIPCLAQPGPPSSVIGSCNGLADNTMLKAQLQAAVAAENSGLNNQMWATIVDRSGIVCAVAFSGQSVGAQWLGSRVISAQKAYTANAFSLDTSSPAKNGGGGPLALSTANLYSAVQPGGSLYGLQASNPVDPEAAYDNPYNQFGTKNDPMVGRRVGGINVFGGGLALYNGNHQLVGAVGVSGDTSCADHDIAWRLRNNLNLDHLGTVIPGPASIFSGDATHPDNIVYDITPNSNGGTGVSAKGFGHPQCLNTGNQLALPGVRN